MSYRIRVVNLLNNRVRWTPLPVGYLGVYEYDDPQVALMIAESLLDMIGKRSRGRSR